MPTYDYKCNACDHRFELFQSMSDSPKRKCPSCGKMALERLIGTGAAVLFKGSGFYQTDYRSESYRKAQEAESKSASTPPAGATATTAKGAGSGDASTSTSSASAGSSTNGKPGAESGASTPASSSGGSPATSGKPDKPTRAGGSKRPKP